MVGGVRHVTSLETLKRFPNTRIGLMAEAIEAGNTAQDKYDFDRSPVIFNDVLDLYRTVRTQITDDTSGPCITLIILDGFCLVLFTMELIHLYLVTKEEGTIPYVPEIPLSTEALINYNRSVFNVDGVFTSPAGLESTSLVFVYGIDIFYTRVMPSRMFDVLKEDFDYLFIGCVLALMIIFSFITQKLAAHKALKRAWK
ncbi:DUF1620 super [Bulinus truncatus]|nr:DUF1620 super [Bulinus truncatus]